MAWTTPRDWSNGELVTEAILDTHIRDNLTELWKYTTNGDLMYATSGTTTARLGIGTTGQTLTVVGGVPAWVSGVPAIFDAKGDLVFGTANNTAGRLPIGSTGQTLTVVSGSPNWTSSDILTGRQGNSATDWAEVGTTNYTPANYQIQVGVRVASPTSAGTATITFPVEFPQPPIVLITPQSDQLVNFHTLYPSTTAIVIAWDAVGTSPSVLNFKWMAIGPAT